MRILVVSPYRRRQLEGLDILGKIILKEGFEVILCVDRGWIYVGQNRKSFRALINVLVKLYFIVKAVKFLEELSGNSVPRKGSSPGVR